MSFRNRRKPVPPMKAAYSVEQYEGTGGSAVLIGFDSHGRPKVEVRVDSASQADLDDLAVRVRAWIMARDPGYRPFPLRLEG